MATAWWRVTTSEWQIERGHQYRLHSAQKWRASPNKFFSNRMGMRAKDHHAGRQKSGWLELLWSDYESEAFKLTQLVALEADRGHR